LSGVEMEILSETPQPCCDTVDCRWCGVSSHNDTML
jgi:hypothetical protein